MGYGVSHVIDGNGSAIAVDADPNTTAPPESRIFKARQRANNEADFGIFAYALAVSHDITLRAWLFDRTMGRWFARGAAVVCKADEATEVPQASPSCALPSGASYFLQCTANAASCTKVGICYFEDG